MLSKLNIESDFDTGCPQYLQSMLDGSPPLHIVIRRVINKIIEYMKFLYWCKLVTSTNCYKPKKIEFLSLKEAVSLHKEQQVRNTKVKKYNLIIEFI
jgi:hypothetical protein